VSPPYENLKKSDDEIEVIADEKPSSQDYKMIELS
jgi:hypothetical protein